MSPNGSQRSPRTQVARSRSPSLDHRGLYLCDKCNRGFKKHEHLQRHENTHTANKPFQCIQCSRKFSRQDSLLRHVRLNHAAKSSSLTGSDHNLSPSSMPMVSEALPLSPSSTLAGGLDRVIEGRGELDSSRTSMWPDNPLEIPASTTRTIIAENDTLSSTTGSLNDQSQTTLWSLPNFDTALGDSQPLPSASEAPYTPAPFPPLGDDIWQLLTQEMLPNSNSLHASPQFLADLGLQSDSLFQAFQQTDVGYDRTESREPANANLYLDRGSFEGPSLASSGVNVEERGEYVLSATSTMIARMSSGLPTQVSPLSSETLALCFNMFWTRIWPTFPILHASTFNMRQTTAPLLINMIALGSLASQTRSLQIKGSSLWTLVNRSITTSWSQLIENRGPYDPCKGVQLIQTLACGLLFASMSASPNIVNTASMTVANGLRWTYLAGMTDPAVTNKSYIPSEEEVLTSSELDTKWRQWAAAEDLKRCLCTIYQEDCILAKVAGLPPTVNPLSITCCGIWDDEASYLAPNALEWKKAILNSTNKVPSVNQIPTNHIYRYFFQDDTTLDAELCLLPMMIRNTIIEGLTSLIIDPVQPHYIPDHGVADYTALSQALSRYYTLYLHRTADPRSQSVLASRWHESAITLGYALAKQKGWSEQEIWHTSLGRHLLLHANSIRQILEDLRIGKAKIPYPSHIQVIYTAALVFKDYITATEGTAKQVSQNIYSMNMVEDWAWLNTSLGTCYTGEADADVIVSSPLTAKDFVMRGGTPVLHGLLISIHDIDPFITVLTALGRTFPRAEHLAMKLVDEFMY